MPRILLVEDNDVNRDMIRRRLEQRGHLVTMASDGEEAIARSKSDAPDLILMDLGLPKIDGWEATRIIRADALTENIPIVALSAHAATADQERAIQAGCDLFLTKPVQMSQLQDTIKQLIDARKSAIPQALPVDEDEDSIAIGSHSGSGPVSEDTAILSTADIVPPSPAAKNSLAETMMLPVLPKTVPPPKTETKPPVVVAPQTDVSVLSKRILVVEDNDANRVMLCRRLDRQGFITVEAADGRAALKVVREQKFDLMLLDVMMPEIDGYQVLQELKGDEDLKALPVIMISALDTMDSVVRCIEMGAEDYLTKPYDPVLLQARINACLDKRRLRDQEKEYLRAVADLTTAAARLEQNAFDPAGLTAVCARPDALGHLATVFQRMALEVQAKVSMLREEVQRLKVEIDDARKAEQVAEITESEYFLQLQSKASELRQKYRRLPQGTG